MRGASGAASESNMVAPLATKKSSTMASAATARRSGTASATFQSFSRAYVRSAHAAVRLRPRDTSGGVGDGGARSYGSERIVARGAESPPKWKPPTVPPDIPSTLAMSLRTVDTLAAATEAGADCGAEGTKSRSCGNNTMADHSIIRGARALPCEDQSAHNDSHDSSADGDESDAVPQVGPLHLRRDRVKEEIFFVVLDPLVNQTIQGGSMGEASSLTTNDYESEDLLPPLDTGYIARNEKNIRFPDATTALSSLNDATQPNRMDSPPPLERIRGGPLCWSNSLPNSPPQASFKGEAVSRQGTRRAPLPESPMPLHDARSVLYRDSVHSRDNRTRGTSMDESEAELKLAHAQNVISQQEQAITRLQQQTALQKKTLDSMKVELELAREESQQRQTAATEFRARSVQERIKLENLYETEVEHTKKLDAQLSKMQTEMSTLKVSLRTARSESARLVRQLKTAQRHDSGLRHGNPQSPSSDQDEQIAALQAEIAQLKTVNMPPYVAVEAIRQQLRRLQLEVVNLRDKEKESYQSYDRVSSQLDAALAKAKVSADAESEARDQLAQVKAELQRLVYQRDAKASKELEVSRQEIASLRNDMEGKIGASQGEIQKLKTSVLQYKQKLTKANEDRLRSNDDHMKEVQKVQKVLTQLNEEAGELQSQFTAQEDRVAQLENELEEARRGDRTPAHRISILEDELKVCRANENALRLELKLQKQLPNEILAQPGGSCWKENGFLRLEVGRLRKKIAEMETKKGLFENAREQALKNEILILKANLQELKAANARPAREAKNEGTQTDAEQVDKFVKSTEGLTSTPSFSFRRIPDDAPSNVIRLRHELSLAKDRLVAARNATRNSERQHFMALSWVSEAPPVCSQEQKDFDDGDYGNSSSYGDEDMEGSSWGTSNSNLMAHVDRLPPKAENSPDRLMVDTAAQSDDLDSTADVTVPASASSESPSSDASNSVKTTNQIIESDREIEVSTVRYADV